MYRKSIMGFSFHFFLYNDLLWNIVFKIDQITLELDFRIFYGAIHYVIKVTDSITIFKRRLKQYITQNHIDYEFALSFFLCRL